MEGFQEKRYQSNFEVLMDALQVRVNPRLLAALNLEEQQGPPDMMEVIESAFKRIDAFGLRVEQLEKDQETQMVYTATLSAFRLKV